VTCLGSFFYNSASIGAFAESFGRGGRIPAAALKRRNSGSGDAVQPKRVRNLVGRFIDVTFPFDFVDHN
jgi:hypothetical protein